MDRLDYSRVLFRADDASTAGMGHLARCRNLALALRKDLEVVFILDQAPDHFVDLLAADEIAWRKSPDAFDASACNVEIFDGYGFRESDYIAAKNRGAIVVAIDDLAARFLDCDLIVSQGPQNVRSDYRAAKDCKFMLGVDYALIDPLFYISQKDFSSKVQRIFLSFGGADPMNLTAFVLNALADTDVQIEAVVGASYAHWDELQSVARPKVSLHRALDAQSLATLMLTCDAAIAAGGTTSLELMAIGIPTILFAFAENHVRPCEAFVAQGLASFGGVISNSADPAWVRKTVMDFLLDERVRRSIGKATAERFVASGLPAIVQEIVQLSQQRRASIAKQDNGRVQLVPLNAQHLNETRRWMEDDRVSRPFLFGRTITEQSHAEWFSNLQNDRSQSVFAILRNNTHVGNTGFKNIRRYEREGEFWIYLNPDVHGQGLGAEAVRAMLKTGFEEFALDNVYLHVSPANLAARRIYEKAAFSVTRSVAKPIVFDGNDVALDRMEVNRFAAGQGSPKRPRVALMQPTFLPWLGYFELMDTADIFVFLDDFQFSRQSWAQRNKLFLSPGRPGLVSMPIQHPGDLSASFLDIAPGSDQRWIDKLEKSLSQAYGRTRFFAEMWGTAEPLLRRRDVNLADYEIGIIQAIARRLGIQTQLRRSSEFGIANVNRSERLVALLDAVGAGSYYAARGSAEYMHHDGIFPLKRLPVFFQNFESVSYLQAGSSEFVPSLSALDALFNLSPAEARQAMFGTRKWLSWQDVNGKAVHSNGLETRVDGISA